MPVIKQRQLPNLLTILPLPLPKPSSSTSPTSGISSLTQVSSITSEISSASESPSVTASSTGLPSSTSESPLIAPTPTPSDLPIQTTTSADGSTYYITLFTTPSPSPSVQAAPSGSKGFLQNKALSGTILAVVGVAGLALLIAIFTLAIRRSRRHRLHAEAISFDPSSTGGDTTEKRRFSLLSSDHGHSVNNSVMAGNLGRDHAGMNPASAPPVGTLQDPYRFPVSESQHTLVGNIQSPWSGDTGTPRVPRTDPRLAWGYGNGPNPVQGSDIPIPSERNGTNEPPYTHT